MRSCSDDGFSGGGGGGATAGVVLAGFDISVAAAVLAFPFPFSSSPFPRFFGPRFSFSAEVGPRLAGAGAAGALLLRGRSGSLLGLGVVAIRGLTRLQQALLALASWNEAVDTHTGQWSH
jgi:hypothetical protein